MKQAKQNRICHDHEALVTAVHKRISPYFRLYRSFVNYKTHMLVSHRNYVSVYDLTQGKWFEERLVFAESVVFLAINERGQPKENSNLLHGRECD